MKQAARAWNRSKSGGASTSRTKNKAKRIPKKRRTITAKKRKRRKNSGMTVSKLFGLLRKAALVAPAVGIAMGGGSGYDKMARGLEGYTGYNIVTQKFNVQPLKNTYLPYIGATVISAGVPKINKFIRGVI